MTVTFYTLLVLFSLTLFALFGVSVYMTAHSLPDRSSTLYYPGMTGPAKVLREPNGMIHIEAEHEEDVYFAQGVVSMQERAWQMEFQRCVGAGRLSEVVGSAAISVDKEFRKLGLYAAAESAWNHVSGPARTDVESYVKGVNAYISSGANLGLEFIVLGHRPALWTPPDVLVWSKVMSYSLSENYKMELDRFRLQFRYGMSEAEVEQYHRPYPADAPTVLTPDDIRFTPLQDDDLAELLSRVADPSRAEKDRIQAIEDAIQSMGSAYRGRSPSSFVEGQKPHPLDSMLRYRDVGRYEDESNNWVVHGNHTASGFPLLANDPHLSLSAPSVWMLIHVKSPSLECIGASFPGIPGCVLGHNKFISWGVTNAMTDIQDLYIMQGNETHYKYQGEMRPYGIREEVIKVQGGSPTVLRLRETVHGTVVNNDNIEEYGEPPLALRWLATDPTVPDTTVMAFMGVIRSKNWNDFYEANRYYVSPAQNMIYADVEGNIGYRLTGMVPVRKTDSPGATYDGLWPVPGDGSYYWNSTFLPYDAVPYTLNPSEGFIVSANNRIQPDNYPYLITKDYADQYRAKRIRQMIEDRIASGQKIDLAYMSQIQGDVVTLMYDVLKPYLTEAVNQAMSTCSSQARQMQQVLDTWNGVAAIGSKNTALFETWVKLVSTAVESKVHKSEWIHANFLSFFFENPAIFDPVCKATAGVSCQQYAGDQVCRAVDRAGGQQWGYELHPCEIKHQVLTSSVLSCFADRKVAHGGDDWTVNVGGFDEDFVMLWGPSYRHIVDLSDVEKSIFIIPMGQSGHLLEEGYENLLPLWKNTEYIPMKTTGYEVSSTQEIKPSSS